MQHLITQLEQLRPSIPVATVQLPDGHTLNDMWVNYGREAITQLLGESANDLSALESLEIHNEMKIGYKGKAAQYFIMGSLPSDLSSLKVAVHVEEFQTKRKHRIRVELYDMANVQTKCKELSDGCGLEYNILERDFMTLTQLLENYREQLFFEDRESMTQKYLEKELTPKAGEKAMEFLTEPNLIQNIDSLLEQSGIVGEQVNRKLLFVVASSFKSAYPLHAMVQASSASGKSHLINSVAACIPQEDLYDNTSFSSKALYYQKDKALYQKLMVIQDFDGLDEEGQYAFRELQSNKNIMRSTVKKDRMGNSQSVKKEIKAHFSSLVATTDLEVYLDNVTRSIMLGVDESEAQTLRIIKRQNERRAGIINTEEEHAAKQLLRNCMRVLKPHTVVNPFADKLTLPVEAKSLRRLNEQFQDFICQVTLLHQFQRSKDQQGRLIATKDDVRLAVELFFTAIILKVDELDGSTRQFFDKLKAFIKSQEKGSTYKFTEREVRIHMKLSKTSVYKFFKLLKELEYIQSVEGAVNKGFKYVISYWDNLDKLKAKIREDLNQQLKAL
ncbi:hypothetical protein ABH942_003313 [Flavobacterium sp. 28YEA47A]|uniref:hypothetical protein n=1 Tax=Flavobacterium sp. 28YEA47A TaxID=3156276 RepID=UPI0035179A2E